MGSCDKHIEVDAAVTDTIRLERDSERNSLEREGEGGRERGRERERET